MAKRKPSGAARGRQSGVWSGLPEPLRAAILIGVVGVGAYLAILLATIVLGPLFGVSVDTEATFEERTGILLANATDTHAAARPVTSDAIPESAILATIEAQPETIGRQYFIQENLAVSLPRNAAVAPRGREIVLMSYVVTNTGQTSLPLDVVAITLGQFETNFILHSTEGDYQNVPPASRTCIKAWFVKSKEQALAPDGSPLSVEGLRQRLEALMMATPFPGYYGGYEPRWTSAVEFRDGPTTSWMALERRMFGDVADAARICGEGNDSS